MIAKPSHSAELAQILAGAAARKQKIERVDLAVLNRIVEYTPEDMTVTVEAGATLAALQSQLARHGQWLPIDPPHSDGLTVAEMIDANANGPRRFGYGTIRDFLIGITVVLADGRTIHSGGKVVKNVAGYDLAKLFIGGRGSLGVVVEATFKLRPLPEMEKFIEASCASLDNAENLVEAVVKSEITPVVLDLHRLAGAKPPTLVLGFAGTREEVEWQLARSAELGVKEPSSLDYETQFWADSAPASRLSVLPSKLMTTVRDLQEAPFVARAGNGIIYHRGGKARTSSDVLPVELLRRVKDTFDPNHVLPEMPL